MFHTGCSKLLVAMYWFPSFKHGFLSASMLRICLFTFKRWGERKRKDEKKKGKKKEREMAERHEEKAKR